MNPAHLLAHFERLADGPDAIPCLRRFILDLAVRGKLVAQDPNDEPAADLLKRIAAKRTRLAKAGEIRKRKSLPNVELDEVPFDVPLGWEWVRIREVTTDRGQKVPDRDFTYVDVTAIDNTVGCIANAKVLSAKEAPSRARKIVRKGDVLYSCVRPYLLNIAVLETDLSPPPIASTAFAVVHGFGLVLPRYQWIVLRSPFMVASVEDKMRGQAYPAINDSDFALLPFPLAPLAEQHRIVAKVDELMALCDRLEAARNERESRRDRLVAASLHRLSQPADEDGDDAFRADARFYLDHLPRLTTRPDHVKQFRQTILNLAVRGRLVPQDPNDEPASELLKQIAAVKAERTASTRGRSAIAPMALSGDDQPYGIPKGWLWAAFGNVTVSRDGERVPVSREERATRGKVYDYYGASGIIDKIDSYLFDKPLLLIGEDGANLINRSTPIAFIARGKYWVNNHAHVLDGLSESCLRYLELFINATDLTPYVTGTAQPKMNQAKMNSIPVALPPLVEQPRIVAKVDELMALCDRLEASLAETEADSRRLLEAVLHEALEPAESALEAAE